MGSWQEYIDLLKQDNVTEHAFIFGSDGALWCSSTGWDSLPTYDFQYENEKGTQTTQVNEAQLLVNTLAKKGQAGTPYGFRFANQKYFGLVFDDEDKTWFLKKESGGACIAVTGKTIIVGTWVNTESQSNGVPQNAAECNKRVVYLQTYLNENGY